MAKRHVVKAARKDQGRCERCGKALRAGEPYQWVQPKTSAYGGVKRKRCTACPPWTAGELTTSRLGAIYDAQAAFSVDDCDTADDVTAAVEELVSVIREVADGDRQAAENIESGFGHATTQSGELAERGDALDSWADDIDGVIVPEPEDHQLDCPECSGSGECAECDGTGQQLKDDNDDSGAADCDGCDGSGECCNCSGEGQDGIDYDAWREAVIDALRLIQECPV